MTPQALSLECLRDCVTYSAEAWPGGSMSLSPLCSSYCTYCYTYIFTFKLLLTWILKLSFVYFQDPISKSIPFWVAEFYSEAAQQHCCPAANRGNYTKASVSSQWVLKIKVEGHWKQGRIMVYRLISLKKILSNDYFKKLCHNYLLKIVPLSTHCAVVTAVLLFFTCEHKNQVKEQQWQKQDCFPNFCIFPANLLFLNKNWW